MGDLFSADKIGCLYLAFTFANGGCLPARLSQTRMPERVVMAVYVVATARYRAASRVVVQD